MNFEIYEGGFTAKHRGHLEDIEMYVMNRRRKLQDWEGSPPFFFGLFILALVGFELALGYWLPSPAATLKLVFRSTVGMIALLTAISVLVAKSADEFSSFLGRKSNFLTTFTFVNVGLLPLLIALPVALIGWLDRRYEWWWLVSIALLFGRVAANWRESIEISMELSRLQSVLSLYLALVMIVGISLVIAYASMLGSVLTALS